MVDVAWVRLATVQPELRSQHFRADRHSLDAFHVRLKPDARAVKDVNPSLRVDLNFGIDDVAVKVPPAG